MENFIITIVQIYRSENGGQNGISDDQAKEKRKTRYQRKIKNILKKRVKLTLLNQ